MRIPIIPILLGLVLWLLLGAAALRIAEARALCRAAGGELAAVIIGYECLQRVQPAPPRKMAGTM